MADGKYYVVAKRIAELARKVVSCRGAVLAAAS